jgi:nucleotide-binding universal stress UspA family protein
VAATGADLLVLGARGVGGVTRLLLGSVAEGALGRAPVSVLVVK